MSNYDFIKYATQQSDAVPTLRILDSDNSVLSNKNLDYHYNILYKNYIEKAEEDEANTFAVAGEELHLLFFEQLFPERMNNTPSGEAKELINTAHNGFMHFKHSFINEAMSIEGSGWCYMDIKGKIKTIPNHQITEDVALIVDMWEHSYYLDYGPDKEAYLNDIWKIIDWDIVNSRLD
jgi:Fe-Mn family superoxide dismutase